jgi:hypothetical protein
MVRTQSPKISALRAATIFLFAHCSATGLGAQANFQPQVEPQSSSLVIQGRITNIQGDLVTVKTPDGYPGGPGVHAQFVTAGPTFSVDVSRARIFLPDGRQVDKVPLAVGDRVLVVLTSEGRARAPGNINHTYSAAIVERLALSDKIVAH